jgi:MFS family permease
VNPRQGSILAACTLGNMVGITPVVSSVFGLFLLPLSMTFGWPRAAISGVLGLFAGVSACMMPVVGRLADRYGARRMLIFGNLAFGGAIALLSLTTGHLVQFYMTFALVAVCAAPVSTPILAKVISDWFDRRRGLMYGVSAGFGNGFGATLIPIIAAVAMPFIGWRGTYLLIAALVVCVGFPVYTLLLRDAPKNRATVGETAHDGDTVGQAMNTRTFWVLLIAIASAAGSMTAVFSHVVPILAERHVGVAAATTVLSVYALVTAAWQIILGFVLDRVQTPRIVVPMYLCSIGGIVLLEWGGGLPVLMVSGVLLGVGLATQYSALPYLIARYFGLRHFGAIMGASYSVVYLMQGITPILLDRMFDVQGTYRGAMFGISCALVIGGAVLLLLPQYRRAATGVVLSVHAADAA